METTTLNRTWLLKMGVFLIVLVVFGVWGLIDALVVYPQRGREHAEFMLKEYLTAAKDVARLGETSVDDPELEWDRLSDRAGELQAVRARATQLQSDAASETPAGRQAKLELNRMGPQIVEAWRYDWLKSLRTVGNLKPDATRLPDPAATLTTLTESWKTRSTPSGLAAYDIPFQWFFAGVGALGGAYMLSVILRAARTKFTWDAQAKKLTLPDSTSVTPEQIKEFDKRKWDKFYITLHLKDGSSKTFDLLRHAKLEGWVLELERIAFPEAAASAAQQEEATNASTAAAPDQPPDAATS